MQRTQTNPRTEIVPVLRVVVAKEGGMTNSYELAQNIVRFGRSPEADVRLEGKNISRVHCILEVREGNLWVRDNDSLNGIFVNGEKVKEAIVTARDGVKVGPYRFKALLTGTTVAPRSEARAVVPAAKANDEMDRTLPAFDAKAAKAAAMKADGPLPKEEQPLRRPSSSVSVVLEEFEAPIMGTEDQTPADGTPVASPAQAIAVKAPEIVPAAAPVSKPSYRSSFEKKAEAPKAEPVVKAEAPRAPVPQRGRMSLTSSGAKRQPGVLKAGDLCPSCSTGSMLTWQGALKCRSCGNTAEIGALSAKSSTPAMKTPAPVSARSESPASIEEPAATSSTGEQKLGELCASCSKGRMLAWEGGLKCRSCGNQSARAEGVAARSSSARPSITPRTPSTTRPSVVTNPAASAAPKSASGTLQVGELCGACYKGRMLTWEGSLKCRSCGNTAEIGASSTVSKKTVEVKPASIVASAKPAVSRTMSSSEVREPNRTAAVITGVGLFLGFYMTVGVCAIASALLV